MTKVWVVAVVTWAFCWLGTASVRAATCQEAPEDSNCTCPSDGNPCTTESKECERPVPGGPLLCSCSYEGRPGASCPAQGVCVATARCGGADGSTCVPDEYRPAGYVCRPATSACDAEDTCTGVDDTCSDRKRPEGEVCRPAQGDCDLVEVCDGRSNACPDDAFAPAANPNRDPPCRVAQGDCDLDDFCTGDSPLCGDALVEAGTPCRDSAGVCNPAEACTGTDPQCPTDEVLEDGYACDDGNACTEGDICLEGQCVGRDVVMCTAPDAGASDAGADDGGIGVNAGDAGIGSSDEGGCRIASAAGDASLIWAALLVGIGRRRRRSSR